MDHLLRQFPLYRYLLDVVQLKYALSHPVLGPQIVRKLKFVSLLYPENVLLLKLNKSFLNDVKYSKINTNHLRKIPLNNLAKTYNDLFFVFNFVNEL